MRGANIEGREEANLLNGMRDSLMGYYQKINVLDWKELVKVSHATIIIL